MAGITMEKYLEDEGQTQEEFEADLDRRVRDAVAAQFILDKIAKKEEFGIDQAELSEHLVRRAQQSGQDPQEFANHMFEHNHIPELVQEILRGKALATIVEAATVKDASGNVVELKNLRPDGTIGEPVEESTEASAEATRAPTSRPRRPSRPDPLRSTTGVHPSGWAPVVVSPACGEPASARLGVGEHVEGVAGDRRPLARPVVEGVGVRVVEPLERQARQAVEQHQAHRVAAPHLLQRDLEPLVGEPGGVRRHARGRALGQVVGVLPPDLDVAHQQLGQVEADRLRTARSRSRSA